MRARAPRSGSKPWVDHALHGLVLHQQDVLATHQAFAPQQVGQQQPGDAGHVRAQQHAERHHAIQPIEKLGPEEPLGRIEIDLVARRPILNVAELALGLANAEVGRQNQQAIGEIDGSAQGVGEPALAQHLQEQVEDLGMGLLDLVEQHHGERPAAHGARQQTFGLEEGAHQAGGRPGFEELVHVEAQQPNHVAFPLLLARASEEIIGQGLGALRLADSRRPQKQKRGQGDGRDR